MFQASLFLRLALHTGSALIQHLPGGSTAPDWIFTSARVRTLASIRFLNGRGVHLVATLFTRTLSKVP